MAKKGGVGEALAGNPTMPIAIAAAGIATGAALLVPSLQDGARRLFRGIRDRLPGGGGGSEPEPAPPAPPADGGSGPGVTIPSSSPWYVEPTPRERYVYRERDEPAPYETPPDHRPPLPTPAGDDDEPNFFERLWQRGEQIIDDARDQGWQFIPGTRIPAPTTAQGGAALGRQLPSIAGEFVEQFVEGVAGIGAGLVQDFQNASPEEIDRDNRAVAREAEAFGDIVRGEYFAKNLWQISEIEQRREERASRRRGQIAGFFDNLGDAVSAREDSRWGGRGSGSRRSQPLSEPARLRGGRRFSGSFGSPSPPRRAVPVGKGKGKGKGGRK